MVEFLNNLKIRFVMPLLNLFFNLRFKKGIILLFNFSTRTFQKSFLKSKIKILILEKNFFNDDMLSCFKGYDDFEIYGLDRKILKLFFYKFLPIEIDENNYLSNDKGIINGKRKLREFWIDILKEIKFFDIIFTGNFSYYAEQEFAAACKINKIKFVALHKETLNTPLLSSFYEWVFSDRKNKFKGDYIFVYNKIGKDSLIKSKVINKNKIAITGMPRLDKLIKKKKKLGDKIVLFSTEEKTGLPELGRKTIIREKLKPELERLSFKKITDSLHHSFIELAKENTHIEFILKGKNVGSSFRYIKEILKQHDIPKNLKIDFYSDTEKIIEQSRVVTGLYTTAIFEALAARIPIIVPRYYEAIEKETKDYFLHINHNIIYAENKNSFKKMIIYYFKNYDKFKTNIKKLDQTLDKWLGNSDGQSGKRVRKFVKKIL